MPPSFTLTEVFAFGDSFEWRLKDSQIRFRGKGQYTQLVNQRIPAGADQIANLRAALNLLDVWAWRDDYDPRDIGWTVLDGSWWTFSCKIGEQTHKCGGNNAFPSFHDPLQTTADRGRYAMLTAAIYACFGIDTYIHSAQHHRQRANQNDGS